MIIIYHQHILYSGGSLNQISCQQPCIEIITIILNIPQLTFDLCKAYVRKWKDKPSPNVTLQTSESDDIETLRKTNETFRQCHRLNEYALYNA